MTKLLHNLTEVAAPALADRVLFIGPDNDGTERIAPYFSVLPIKSLKHYGGIGDDSALNDTAFADAISDNSIIFVPAGVYKVSEPVVINKHFTLIGEGSFRSIIKANTTDFNVCVIDGTGVGLEVQMMGLQLASGQKGLVIDEPLTQSSSFVDILASGNTLIGVEILKSIYSCKFQQVRASGGQKGIVINGNSPTNKAEFTGTRVSNTSVRALEITNTGLSVTSAMFRDTILEGNNGAAIYTNNVSATFDNLWLEKNGKITGDPDILLDNPTTVVNNLLFSNVTLSTTGDAQDGELVRFLDTHIRLDWGPGVIPSARYVNGNNQITGGWIRFWGHDDVDVRNWSKRPIFVRGGEVFEIELDASGGDITGASGNLVSSMEFGKTYHVKLEETEALNGDTNTTFELGDGTTTDLFLAVAATGSAVGYAVVDGSIGKPLRVTIANNGSASAGKVKATVVVK